MPTKQTCCINGPALEALYEHYNRREFVSPDPVQFLHEYADPKDREVVALVAAALSYGRVAQILRSVESALRRMGSPREFVACASPQAIRGAFRGFRHRFADGRDMAELLTGARQAVRRHGSLGACFAANDRGGETTIVAGLTAFVDVLSAPGRGRPNHLLPSPRDGSACKRWNLLLRWLVRRDAVDPGGWAGISPSRLIVPLDTHMHRIGRELGLTRRRAADLRTAIEITEAFRAVAPDDPVRYDFALTRLGIRTDADWESFVKAYSATRAA